MKEGVFWGLPQNANIGNEKFLLLINFSGTVGHSEIWETIRQENQELSKFDYEYFPRGRVWIKNGVATILLDPKINFPIAVEKIKKEFELNGVVEVVNDRQ